MFLTCSERNIYRKNIIIDQTFVNFPNKRQLLTIIFLPNYAFLYLKYMEKSVHHNLCHKSHEPCILFMYIAPHVP